LNIIGDITLIFDEKNVGINYNIEGVEPICSSGQKKSKDGVHFQIFHAIKLQQ
jgi:hypothetical protein